MSDERQFTLRQIDQARGDLYAISDDLEFLKVQLARLPTRKQLMAGSANLRRVYKIDD